MKSINPHTNETLNKYEKLTSEKLNEYIKDSQNCYNEWRHTSFNDRAKLLKAAGEILKNKKTYLAELMADEMGKPLKEGQSEIDKCAWVCDYYAENAEKFLAKETIKTDYQLSEVHYSSIGPLFAIMPWNYPFWQVFRFAAPNLMAGNTALLKHAENVTGCSIEIEKIFKEANFPKGAFKSLLIDREQAKKVIEHDSIRAITLTGSTAAGKSVASTAGENIKKTVLELGGSDAYLILADADINHAAKTCAEGRFSNGGQSCISPKRFIVDQSIAEEFENKLLDHIKKIKMGDPKDPSTDIGPLARVDLRDSLAKQVEESIKQGAQCLIGGKTPELEGAYYPATLLTNVQKGMPAYEEELFGPVAVIIKAKNTEDAINIANASQFGLGGGIFSKDTENAKDIAINKFDSGACFINDYVKSNPKLPFGGVKESGYGRELAHHGIKEFVNIKTVCIK